MKRKAKLVLFCGLPGSGKTTLAKELSEKYQAIRLNTDEWMADLGFDPNYDRMHIKLQNRLWELAKELLSNGQDIILENGLWTKKERDDKRRDAKEIGVDTEMHYLDVPLEELKRRLESRNNNSAHGQATVSNEVIEKFSTIFEAPDKIELELFTVYFVH